MRERFESFLLYSELDLTSLAQMKMLGLILGLVQGKIILPKLDDSQSSALKRDRRIARSSKK